MPTPRMTDETMLRAAQAVIQAGDIQAAALVLDIPRGTLKFQIAKARKRWPGWLPRATGMVGWAFDTPMQPPGIEGRRLAERGLVGGPAIPQIGRPPDGFRVSRNSATYDAGGNLVRQWVGTKPDAGAEYAVPAGHTVKGESALLDPENRVLAKWVKTTAGVDAGVGLVEALKAAFDAYAGMAPLIPDPAQAAENGDLLTVYPIPDLHFGMRSWREEAGADYDLAIASQVARQSVATLVQQSLPSSHAIVIILGDWWHQNDSKNATPGSGHQLDVDGRWPKVYLEGCKLAVSLIECVAAKHSHVQVVVRPGNHDSDAAVTLTVALSMFYEKNERITVDMTPGITWYRRFGACLLGAHHGHTQKPERAVMAMAVDCHTDWGLSQHRHIFSGHIHTATATEIAGVKVESFNSPAARDAWNAASGYRSGRSLSAITFHEKNGEIGRHKVNITGPAQWVAA